MVFGLRVGSFITDPHSFRESLSDNICRRPVTGEHGCHVHTSTLVDFSPALGRMGNRENVYVATIGGTLVKGGTLDGDHLFLCGAKHGNINSRINTKIQTLQELLSRNI